MHEHQARAQQARYLSRRHCQSQSAAAQKARVIEEADIQRVWQSNIVMVKADRNAVPKDLSRVSRIQPFSDLSRDGFSVLHDVLAEGGDD